MNVLTLYRKLDPQNPLRGFARSIRSLFAREDEFVAYANLVSPLKDQTYVDFTEMEKSIYLLSHKDLQGSADAVISLIRSVQYVVENDIPGVFVECGVYKGGNIEVMIRTLQHLGIENRDIYLYDTFVGMPRPDDVDDEGLGDTLRSGWQQHRTEVDGDAGSVWMRGEIETVRNRIAPLNYPADRLHFIKGMVEHTIPRTLPDKIALLRLDTDFYASTKHELVHLYPRLCQQGILIIDDYGALPGCRRAVHEYAAEYKPRWFLNRVDAHVRLVVKS
jgi:O-methyltransferase